MDNKKESIDLTFDNSEDNNESIVNSEGNDAIEDTPKRKFKKRKATQDFSKNDNSENKPEFKNKIDEISHEIETLKIEHNKKIEKSIKELVKESKALIRKWIFWGGILLLSFIFGINSIRVFVNDLINFIHVSNDDNQSTTNIILAFMLVFKAIWEALLFSFFIGFSSMKFYKNFMPWFKHSKTKKEFKEEKKSNKRKTKSKKEEPKESRKVNKFKKFNFKKKKES